MLHKKNPIALAALCLSISQVPVSAIIIYSGDNDANITAPDAARKDIFDSVGRIAGGSRGSVVHIRGKYLLTAQHVNTSTNLVSFDGVTNWAIDTSFSAVQIGPADMKLVKLVDDPGLPETELLSGGEINAQVTLIGWGVGRNEGVADSGAGPVNIWDWGESETLDKRWGTNDIDIASNATIAGYTYDFLQTDLDSSGGSDEAAVTLYDSGSGLFFNDGGTWKLAGIATAVSSPGSSTFSISREIKDSNFFVRVSSYVDDIEAAIPDTSSYSGWQIDHSLYGNDALDTADTDNDGVRQLEEFAYGGNPHFQDINILPSSALVEDGGSTYLEISITRPVGIQGIDYTPQTTSDLNAWPADSTGIVEANRRSSDNDDGTETLTYRRTKPVSASSSAFIRVAIAESL